MTDYVCFANAGPRFAGKIKSRSTARSRAEPDSPGRRRARGEKHSPSPIASLAIAEGVKGSLRSRPRPFLLAPGEAGDCAGCGLRACP